MTNVRKDVDICLMRPRIDVWNAARYVAVCVAVIAALAGACNAQDTAISRLQPASYGERLFPGIRCLVRCDSSAILTTIDDVFLSTNNGASWSELVAPLLHKSVVDIVPRGDTIFVLTSNGAVHRTTNHGLTWSKYKRSSDNKPNRLRYAGNDVESYADNYAERKASTLYARFLVQDSTLTIEHAIGISCTITSNVFVEATSITATDSSVFLGRKRLPILYVDTRHHSFQELEMGPLDAEFIHTVLAYGNFLFVGVESGKGGIYRRHLQGNSWDVVNIDRNNETVDVERITRGSTGLYFGFRNHGIAFLPNNSLVAMPIHDGLIGAVAQTSDPYRGGYIVTARLRGLVRVAGCGQTLDRFSTTMPNSSEYVAAVTDSAVFVGLHEGYVVRTLDDGLHWDTLSLKLSISAINKMFCYEGSVLICTLNGVWKSTDLGETWTKAFAELPHQEIQDVYRFEGGWVVRANDESYVCSDNGTYSVFNPAGSFEFKPHILDVKIDHGVIYAAGYPGVFVSKDFGVTWRVYTVADNMILRSINVFGENVVFTGVRGQIFTVNIKDLR
jgi:photosystem II stability/assembly factor-like uncharacterized protein